MRRFLFAAAVAAAASLVLAAAGAATNQGHEASPAGDPFAACSIGQDVFGGVDYADTELEPWVAQNPANPDNMIGSFQQDRWSDGGAKGLVASWSFKDGLQWGETPLPFSKCAAPYYGGAVLPYDRASDPWDSFGPDGTAYAVSISFDANDNNGAVGAAVSHDGGVTWTHQQAIQVDLDTDPTQPFNDKESVTADPIHPGVAYAVWDRLALRSCGPAGPATHAPEVDAGPWARAGAVAAPICFEGPTYFSRTLDGGVTWSVPHPIVTNLPNEQTIGNQIVVNPKTGTVYDFYTYITAAGVFLVQNVSSNDLGTTWSAPQTVAEMQLTTDVYDPRNGAPLRTGAILASPAIDPNTGQLYVVWEDARYNAATQEPQVVISTSTLGGLTGTWSTPTLVNPPGDAAAFTPAIVVNNLSQVGVTFYDFRHPQNQDATLPVDYWLAVTDGPGVDFSHSYTRIAGPFNEEAAPFAGGFFVGDYEGLTVDRDGKQFHPFWSQMNCDTTNCQSVPSPVAAPLPPGTPDPMDVYSSKNYKG